MTEPTAASPALDRIRAAHDAWTALRGDDPEIRSAPWNLALAQAGLPGAADGWPTYLDAIGHAGPQVEAATFRQLHMAAAAEAHLRARQAGPQPVQALRGPDGALDLAAFDRLSWEVFELEAAIRALPAAWPGRGPLAGVMAAWRAPYEELRAEAARGHVAGVLARSADADPEARLADLAALAFWAPKLAPDMAFSAQVSAWAHAAVEAILASLEGAAPDLAAWLARAEAAADDAPLRDFEDQGPRRARVLAERLADPRQSGAWGTEVKRSAWRDRAEAAAGALEGPLGELAVAWAAAALDRQAGAPDRAAVLRVVEWLQRVPEGDPRLAALAARCEALDAEAGRMWRDRRMAVIRERGPRPGAPSIAEGVDN